MTYRWASVTHRGRIRATNEDAVHPDGSGRGEGPLVVAVADGMGGHAAGDVASRLALETALEADGEPRGRVARANQAVLEASLHRAELAGMGTTLTLARLGPEGNLEIAHVGDSRAYLFREGVLRQLTTDHSLMHEYLEAGRIQPEEVSSHPLRSVLTQALGLEPEVEIEEVTERLHPGDRLLLCSDGLTSMVPDEVVAELLARHDDPDDTAWALIEAANQAGGEDNVSVVVVDIS